jgi:hypothetical protein
MARPKSTWNYRVFKHIEYGFEGEEIDIYSIKEAYYNDDVLDGWTENGMLLDGYESVEDMKASMLMMMSAFEKPVIELNKDGNVVNKRLTQEWVESSDSKTGWVDEDGNPVDNTDELIDINYDKYHNPVE